MVLSPSLDQEYLSVLVGEEALPHLRMDKMVSQVLLVVMVVLVVGQVISPVQELVDLMDILVAAPHPQRLLMVPVEVVVPVVWVLMEHQLLVVMVVQEHKHQQHLEIHLHSMILLISGILQVVAEDLLMAAPLLQQVTVVPVVVDGDIPVLVTGLFPPE
jgi:hypothetical protein